MSAFKLTVGTVVGFLLLIVFFGTYFTVEQNERAVVTRFGQVVSVAEPGLHFKLPMVNNVITYPIDIKDLSPPCSKQPCTGVNTYTIDNQEVDINFNVFYRVRPEKVDYIYTNVPDYRERLYVMAVDRLKVEMGKVNVNHVSEKRGEIRDAVKTSLARSASSLGLEVTDFQLTNMEFTKSFRDAVNQAAVQKAGVEQRQYERLQSEVVAERDRIVALGKANAQREQAKGNADAILVEAEATAKAIKLKGEAEAAAIQAQAKALSDNQNLVDLRKAERWDGKLPSQYLGGSGAGTLFMLDANPKRGG